MRAFSRARARQVQGLMVGRRGSAVRVTVLPDLVLRLSADAETAVSLFLPEALPT